MSPESAALPIPAGRRLLAVSAAAAPAVSPGAAARAAEVKEIQRRAFERGRAVEAAEWSHRLEKLLGALAAAEAELRRAREADRRSAEAFAARLAAVAAERLVHAVVEEGRHDIRAMVQGVLAEVGVAPGDEGVRVRLNPEDHALLTTWGQAAPAEDGIAWTPDPAMPRGSFEVSHRGIDFYASLTERLEAVRALWLEEAQHRD